MVFFVSNKRRDSHYVQETRKQVDCRIVWVRFPVRTDMSPLKGPHWVRYRPNLRCTSFLFSEVHMLIPEGSRYCDPRNRVVEPFSGRTIPAFLSIRSLFLAYWFVVILEFSRMRITQLVSERSGQKQQHRCAYFFLLALI